jgi:AcrR family transcriptional regulator
MTDRKRTQISSRKRPKQARSADLVATILEAAIQVLAKEGAERFTTVRVAERAGVSVGSLYQYFPNKAAILFRMQSDEWRQTTSLLKAIVEDTRQPPFARLRALVRAFIRSECDEAQMRMALDDAAPRYHEESEADEARLSGRSAFNLFLRELLPTTSDATRALAGDLIKTVMQKVGKDFSETRRTPSEIETYADAMTDMFGAYLKSLEQAPSSA